MKIASAIVHLIESLLKTVASDWEAYKCAYMESKNSLNIPTLEHTRISKGPKTCHYLGDIDRQKKIEHLTPLERNRFAKNGLWNTCKR